MTYKKYIRKNGKLYGPYIYSSKRVDGKVVSEYYGAKEESTNYKTWLFIFAGIVLLATLIFFFVTLNKGMTGNVVMGLDASYEEGKPLDGVLRFSLREGELLPEGTHIIFENSGGVYDFILKNILEEKAILGDYYVYNKDISGSGLGYGIEGENIIYPEIEFTLQIYSESEEGTGGSSQEGVVVELNESGEEVTEEEIIVEETETVLEEEVVLEEVVEETESKKVVLEEIPVEIVEEQEELNEVTPEVVQEETIPEKPVVEESSSAPITGNIVRNSGGIFASFFKLTGMVSLQLENEINGRTSKNNPFIYELREGETAELVPKSIRLGDQEMGDGIVSLRIENGKAIVSTDYSEMKKGYGKEYIGSKEEIISLDLGNLNLSFEEGNLNVKLVYGEDELVHLTTSLKSGNQVSNETEIVNVEEIINETEENETIEIPVEVESNETVIEENETIEEIFNSSLWKISDFLTEDERKILLEEFGEISLQTTQSEIFKGRIIKGYSLGDYSIAYSYDSSIIKDLLEVQMERDRIKFLKDIAKTLSKEKISSQILEDNESYIF